MRCLQLRVNQDEPADDYEAPRAGAGEADDSVTEAQSCKDQMRTNVINEILSTERDYIKHLRDICEVRRGGRACSERAVGCVTQAGSRMRGAGRGAWRVGGV